MAAVITRGFARSAPGKVIKTRAVDIRVTDMSARDALWWDTRLGPYHARIAGRADRLWSWSALLPACHLVQLSKRRYCRPLVVWARADNNQFLRVAMSILIENYPHLDIKAPAEAYFVWFMSVADEATLIQRFGMSNPPSLSRTLLDNAIVLSMNADLAGRIGLHAAKAGGPGLLAVYRKCQLLSLPESAPLPKAIKRLNDGRFFYTDEPLAERLAQILDPAR